MDTEEDAARDEFYDRITAEVLADHRDIIISEFVEDRLAAYFDARPEIEKSAEKPLSTAKMLLTVNPSASLVFSMTSVEISMRDLLLKPIVAGLVHNPDIADVVADLVDAKNKKTITLLDFVFTEIGLPSIRNQTLCGDRLLWSERRELQEMRNGIVHRGDDVEQEHAQRGLNLAKHFIRKLYPAIRDHLTHRSTGWV